MSEIEINFQWGFIVVFGYITLSRPVVTLCQAGSALVSASDGRPARVKVEAFLDKFVVEFVDARSDWDGLDFFLPEFVFDIV